MGFKFHQICRVQKARLLYQQSKTSTTYALNISILKAIKRLVNVYNTSAEYVHLPFIAILKAIKRLVNVYNTSAEYVHLPMQFS